jgi:hypothetical protein
LEKVIKTLEISKDEDVLLILTSLLKDLLKDSLEVRNYFLKLLGFESMFLLLSTQWEDEKKNLAFLQNWFSIIYYSIQSKENRVYLERNMSKLSSRGEILDHCYNEDSLLLVIHGFLGLSVQNQDIFQKTGTNLLTQQPVIIADAFFYDYLLSIVQRLHQKNLYLDVILQFLLYTPNSNPKTNNNRIEINEKMMMLDKKKRKMIRIPRVEEDLNSQDVWLMKRTPLVAIKSCRKLISACFKVVNLNPLTLKDSDTREERVVTMEEFQQYFYV